MHWHPFEFQGETYDLSHLHPCVHSYLQPAKGTNPPRGYKVQVTYSLHCFTRAGVGEIPDGELLYSDSRETRIFDFERYNLSRQLPAIIRTLPDRRCFHAERSNYFTIDVVKEQAALEYEVYFALSRSSTKGLLNLFVQSAYGRDTRHGANKPQHRKPVGFYTILHGAMK